MEPDSSREHRFPALAVKALAVNYQHFVKSAPVTIDEKRVDTPQRLVDP